MKLMKKKTPITKHTSTPVASGTKRRGSSIRTGADARKSVENEKAKNELKSRGGYKPFRFFLKTGQSTKYVILDDRIDVSVREHRFRDDNNKWVQEVCANETEVCPLCEDPKFGQSKLYSFLSIIDLTRFTTKTGEVIKFSKKLLPITLNNQEYFNTLYASHGTLRGVLVNAKRSDSPTSFNIGDILIPEKRYEEGELTEKFSTDVVVKNGTVTQEKNHCLVPFDYQEVFQEKTAEELRMVYGGAAPLGDDGYGDAPF